MGEIVVFTDAGILLDHGALASLVGHFNDPSVGCVSGEDYVEGGGSEGLYGRLELLLRREEARLHSIAGASGCFYGMRRSLCRAVPSRHGAGLSLGARYGPIRSPCPVRAGSARFDDGDPEPASGILTQGTYFPARVDCAVRQRRTSEPSALTRPSHSSCGRTSSCGGWGRSPWRFAWCRRSCFAPSLSTLCCSMGNWRFTQWRLRLSRGQQRSDVSAVARLSAFFLLVNAAAGTGPRHVACGRPTRALGADAETRVSATGSWVAPDPGVAPA